MFYDYVTTNAKEAHRLSKGWLLVARQTLVNWFNALGTKPILHRSLVWCAGPTVVFARQQSLILTGKTKLVYEAWNLVSRHWQPAWITSTGGAQVKYVPSPKCAGHATASVSLVDNLATDKPLRLNDLL